MQSLSKFQWHFFTEIEKTILKIPIEPQKILKSQSILSKKNKAGSSPFSVFKSYLILIVIEIEWYWHINRHIEH